MVGEEAVVGLEKTAVSVLHLRQHAQQRSIIHVECFVVIQR